MVTRITINCLGQGIAKSGAERLRFEIWLR